MEDNTTYKPSDIWRKQIETPEEVEQMLTDVEDALDILKKKRKLLLQLMKLSVGVYGEPDTPKREDEDDGRELPF